VNFKQLKAQLRREVKASPKKAALLGLALCVGLYYWVPMLWRLLPGSSPPAVESADGTIDPETLMARLGTTMSALEAPNPTAELPWQKLAEEIDADPLMVRGAALPETRDPFSGPKVIEAVVDPQALAAEAASQLAPDEMGLELTSTLIGPRRRLALINGDVYTVGSQINLGNGVVFVVAEVDADRVVLVRGDRQFALAIPDDRATSSGGATPSAIP